MPNASFFDLATTSQVVKTALRISLIVGSILALINHGEGIVNLSLSSQNIIQILLTYLVPYGVSTYSSVKALQSRQNDSSTNTGAVTSNKPSQDKP